MLIRVKDPTDRKSIEDACKDDWARNHVPSIQGLSGGSANKVGLIHRMVLITIELKNGGIQELAQELHWQTTLRASTLINDFIPFMFRHGAIAHVGQNNWKSCYDPKVYLKKHMRILALVQKREKEKEKQTKTDTQ